MSLPRADSIVDGWWQAARKLPSPNFSPRNNSDALELLVIHNISLPPGQFGGGFVEQFFLNTLPIDAHPWFCNIDGVHVSAHCFIDRAGKATQFVPFHAKAWHAGESSWCGKDNCNDYSIGIELEGSDVIAYTENQYLALAQLSKTLMSHYSDLNRRNIVGHQDIAPDRKTDPGPAFDWEKYHNLLDE